jgi:hypothetical protein
MMKIYFSNRANSELDLLCKLENERTGFVFGFDLGFGKLIDTILPLNFQSTNIGPLYQSVYKHKGDSLLGVFFLNKNYFLDDCFFENIILTIKAGQLKIFKYGFDDRCREKICTQIGSP